jgi:hypothetical protein
MEITQIIMGSIGVGFLLVYFKDILVPFVVAVFIVYLLVSLFGYAFSFQLQLKDPLVI